MVSTEIFNPLVHQKIQNQTFQIPQDLGRNTSFFSQHFVAHTRTKLQWPEHFGLPSQITKILPQPRDTKFANIFDVNINDTPTKLMCLHYIVEYLSLTTSKFFYTSPSCFHLSKIPNIAIPNSHPTHQCFLRACSYFLPRYWTSLQSTSQQCNPSMYLVPHVKIVELILALDEVLLK